jgi:hypothetical protein
MLLMMYLLPKLSKNYYLLRHYLLLKLLRLLRPLLRHLRRQNNNRLANYHLQSLLLVNNSQSYQHHLR